MRKNVYADMTEPDRKFALIQAHPTQLSYRDKLRSLKASADRELQGICEWSWPQMNSVHERVCAGIPSAYHFMVFTGCFTIFL